MKTRILWRTYKSTVTRRKFASIFTHRTGSSLNESYFDKKMPDIRNKSPVNERETAFHENLFRPFLTSIPQKLSVWIINSVKMPDMRGLKICRKWTNFIRIRFKRFTVGKFPKRNHRVIRIIFHKNRNLLTVNLTFFGSETGGIGQNDTKQHFQKFPKAKRGYDTCCKM